MEHLGREPQPETPEQPPQSALSRFNLVGRNAIITGGSTGIGAATVRGLAELGASVVFNSTERSRYEALALENEESAKGHKVAWIPGDIREDGTLKSIVNFTKANFGPSHILICCAGQTMDGAFLRMSDENFKEMFAIKVDSARKLTQGVLIQMKKEGFGRIVYVGSVAADGSPWQLSYSMANKALEALAMSTALMYPEAVSANVVKPALVDTKMTGPEKLKTDSRDKIIGMMPIGRIIQPEEVADAIIMFVAQRTAAINGTTLYVDGGMSRR